MFLPGFSRRAQAAALNQEVQAGSAVPGLPLGLHGPCFLSRRAALCCGFTK